MSALRDAAVEYAQAGFSVVPVTPGAKKPPLVPWQEYQTTRATPEQVEQWWSQWPDANIALIGGMVSGVNILDLDARSGAVLDDWKFATPTVWTPSGGRHLYFRADVVSGSPVGVLPGVDLRCEAAYVIAPPSNLDRADASQGIWCFESPEHEQRLLSRELLPWSDVLPRLSVAAQPSGPQEPWVAQALAEGVPIGEQRHTLLKLAGYFARRMPDDVVAGLLWGAASRWAQDDSRPWRRDEVDAIVAWVYKQVAEAPREATFRFKSSATAPLEDTIARVRGRFKTSAARSTEPSAKIDWIVDNLIARGATTELIAPPKLGKTTLMLDVVGHVLASSAVFGVWASRTTPVALLSEQSPASLSGSLARAGLLGSEELWILTASDLYQLTWPQVVEVAVASALEQGCGLLVIDTVAWLAGVEDENKAADAKRALEPLGAAIQAGMGVLLVRHSRKGASSVFEAGRGSGAWSGAVDIMASLRQTGDSDLRRLQTIGRLGDGQDIMLSYTAGKYAKSDETPTSRKAEKMQDRTLDKIEGWVTREWATVREVAERADRKYDAVRKALLRFTKDSDPHGEVVEVDMSSTPYRYRLTPTFKCRSGEV